MSGVGSLLRDLEQNLVQGSTGDRALTTSRLTDLFLATARDLTEEQVGIFDVVIGRLATAIEESARAELAGRLADVPNAPHGVVRQLALDEIDVARPILANSRRLTDDDLIAIAASKGRDHMLAICERPGLNEPVTDFLVLRGDGVVTSAVVANPEAKFSRRGMSLLVTRAARDESLQALLSGRSDVPEELAAQLVAVAKDAVRRKLAGALPTDAATVVAGAVERGATGVTATRMTEEVGRFGKAMVTVRQLVEEDRLDELAVARFAGARSVEETICAVSSLTRLGLPATERALLGPDRDTSLIIGKALKWSWPTVKALLSLRPAEEQAVHLVERAQQNFEQLAPLTAQRVLRFLQVREQAGRTAVKTP